MKLDISQVEQYLKKIANSSMRSIQANTAQFFEYLNSNIDSNNPKLLQLESERKTKWSDWPGQDQYWEIPLEVTEARSLSYAEFKFLAEKGYQYLMQIYLCDYSEAYANFIQDFLDHFFQVVQEINNAESGRDVDQRKEIPPDSTTVFVVHGRNEKLRASTFDFLRSIGLSPLEWSRILLMTKKGSPFIGEVLETAFSQAQAVVVLLTPDDEAKLRDEFLVDTDEEYEKVPTGQARPNVLFEGGMAMGRHPERTIFVQLGTTRPFSDVVGRHMVKMSNAIDKRQDLANRLKAAGCAVNLEGTDWHKTGDFTI
jgi:predicted nucleotide-binding protein